MLFLNIHIVSSQTQNQMILKVCCRNKNEKVTLFSLTLWYWKGRMVQGNQGKDTAWRHFLSMGAERGLGGLEEAVGKL